MEILWVLRINKMPEQIYRKKGGIVCPGKVTANVSLTFCEINEKTTTNLVSDTSGSFVPTSPQIYEHYISKSTQVKIALQ